MLKNKIIKFNLFNKYFTLLRNNKNRHFIKINQFLYAST